MEMRLLVLFNQSCVIDFYKDIVLMLREGIFRLEIKLRLLFHRQNIVKVLVSGTEIYCSNIQLFRLLSTVELEHKIRLGPKNVNFTGS